MKMYHGTNMVVDAIDLTKSRNRVNYGNRTQNILKRSDGVVGLKKCLTIRALRSRMDCEEIA